MGIELTLKALSRTLRDLADRLDAGNSNLGEDEAVELVKLVSHYTNTEEYISKYEACEYLNISRATFDNLVKAGKMPKGKKRIGFKELAYTKKELDKYAKVIKQPKRGL